MKFRFVFTGKTRISYIDAGIMDYFKRLEHYVKSELIVLPDIRNTKSMSREEQMKREGEGLLKAFPENSRIILLDEKGKKFDSLSFAGYLQQKMMEGRDICMAIGGPYGFSPEVRKKSDTLISLSSMTFSHQMVRLILLEQVYRAFTIMKNEPYHHS
ncbi:MAG: 23S rRNA (pseudouridine(1915)-N(3))-methyltransferase RlmH [Bacteroidota bacterium]